MIQLLSSFNELPNAAAAVEFHAIPISIKRKDFLAKNEEGAPIFLLHDSSVAKYKPSINFRYVSAQFHATCHVQTGDLALQDQFCLVSCDASVPELHEIFIRCVGAVIEELPDTCSTQEIESCILQLRNLFRALTLPNGREVAGLWAELFVITRSGNPAMALELWRQDQFDRFDFSSNTMNIEVKSTLHSHRMHEFSLEQLEAPIEGGGFVVSVLLRQLSGVLVCWT